MAPKDVDDLSRHLGGVSLAPTEPSSPTKRRGIIQTIDSTATAQIASGPSTAKTVASTTESSGDGNSAPKRASAKKGKTATTINNRDSSGKVSSNDGLMGSRWASSDPARSVRPADDTEYQDRIDEPSRSLRSGKGKGRADTSQVEAPSTNRQFSTSAEVDAPKKQSFNLPIRSSPRLAQSSPKARENPRLHLLPRPKPNSQYMALASKAPTPSPKIHHLLVILDLNGTLLFRHKGRSNSAAYLARPGLSEFLTYLFENHSVMVWSSARPENVAKMCSFFTPEQKPLLAATWARDKLRLSEKEYNAKVQVYKQLSWVWEDPAIQATCPVSEEQWGQCNTVLIDDSREKAASEPFNILEVDEFEGKPEQMEEDVLGLVKGYLEVARACKDVSSFMKKTPFRAWVEEQKKST